METGRQEAYLQVELRIGDALLGEAEHDDNGAYWRTMRLVQQDGTKRIAWKVTESLYSGVAGIALFLIDLYRACGTERHLRTAQSAMHRLQWYCERHPTDYWALYTGRMGVAFALMQLASVTGDRRHLNDAVSMAQHCGSFLVGSHVPADLLNGASGTLLALLHLHAASGNDELLQLGSRLADWLADSAWFGPSGLCWDRTEQQIRPLCGLAHGAAGIGFALLEMAEYTGAGVYRWLAEQAFRYEHFFFDAHSGNWPDFRKIVNDDEGKFRSGRFAVAEIDALRQPGYMNAWCHGAVGIGLSRLRAFQLTGRTVYADEARAALESASSAVLERGDNRMRSILCHGYAGNAELCLLGYRVLGEERYRAVAESVADATIEDRLLSGEYRHGYQVPGIWGQDLSLFMGSAGIGHFLLRMARPDAVRSILLPVLERRDAHFRFKRVRPNGVSTSDLARRVAGRGFRRTLYLLECVDRRGVVRALDAISRAGANCDVKSACAEMTEEYIRRLPEPTRRRVEDVFLLEARKLELDCQLDSAALLYVERHLRAERLRKILALRDRNIADLLLRRCSNIDLIWTLWCWNSTVPGDWVANLRRRDGEFGIVLVRTERGIVETPATPLTMAILETFEGRTRLDEGVAKVVGYCSELSADTCAVESTVRQQLREVLAAGFLEEAE